MQAIAWGFEKVEATTATGQQFNANKVIITVPTSVLQTPDTAASIRFRPQLTQHQQAFNDLGYGAVIKFLIEFWFL